MFHFLTIREHISQNRVSTEVTGDKYLLVWLLTRVSQVVMDVKLSSERQKRNTSQDGHFSTLYGLIPVKPSLGTFFLGGGESLCGSHRALEQKGDHLCG